MPSETTIHIDRGLLIWSAVCAISLVAAFGVIDTVLGDWAGWLFSFPAGCLVGRVCR